MKTIKIMTFNLRVPVRRDGVNDYPNRQPGIVRMLEEEAPDLIGFQEASESARRELALALSERYCLIGCGREADYSGEGVPVAYRRDRFEAISYDTFWLSDRPRVPGSRYEDSDQSKYPRMAHVLRLHLLEENRPVTLINTHLDHIGPRARTAELNRIRQEAEAVRGIGFLTGDFNATPDSPEISRFTGELSAASWQDVTAGAAGTFHAFGKMALPTKIDYIYANSDARVIRAYTVADPHENGIYDSDHAPLCASFEVL